MHRMWIDDDEIGTIYYEIMVLQLEGDILWNKNDGQSG